MGDVKKKVLGFMEYQRHKMLNKLFIKGEIKLSFFRKPIYFELHIFSSPTKEIILDVIPVGIDLDESKLKIDFKKGDSIEKAKAWCERNGYDIYYKYNRIQY